jgi:hypothetical protein
MANRILNLSIRDHPKDPTSAELWVGVYPERLTSRTEARGRLLGPRCAYATTVEVAYPMRSHSRQFEKEGDPCELLRVVIPEPSLWEPETPFLYQGVVELWEKGERCDQVQFQRGLRDLKLGPPGLRLNHRPYAIRGVARDRFSVEDLPSLRQAGFNTLLTTPSPESEALWAAADQLGFLMLGRVTGRESARQAFPLNEHSAVLGWLLAPDPSEPELFMIGAPAVLQGVEDRCVGVELSQPPSVPLSKDFSFLYCEKNLLPSLEGIQLPKLIRTDQATLATAEFKEPLSSPGIMGWIIDPYP